MFLFFCSRVFVHLTVLAKAEARRIRTVSLSDIEMRKDFQAIISDWRERSTKYLSTYSEFFCFVYFCHLCNGGGGCNHKRNFVFLQTDCWRVEGGGYLMYCFYVNNYRRNYV